MVNNNNSISKQGNDKDAAIDNVSSKKADNPQISKDDDIGFKELYEQSLQTLQLGEIVTGKVVQINNDVVMVDVGWKTEGYIPARELKDDAGNISIAVGDEIEILVDRRDTEGNLVLSRDKAAKIKIWDDVKIACEQNTPLKGLVKERVKGGLSVDIGILAFLPGSQVDINPVRDLDKYVGKSLMFNVLKYDRKRNNVVLSRRSILESQRDEEKKKTLETIEEGKIVEGVIKNIGFSYHKWNDASQKCFEVFDVDAVLCPINASKYTGNEDNMMPIAIKRDIGIIAIKILGQNMLIGNVTGDDLIRYTLSLPGLAVANVGIDGWPALESTVAVAKEPLITKEQREKINKQLAFDPKNYRLPYYTG